MYQKNASGLFKHLDFLIFDLIGFVVSVVLSFNWYVAVPAGLWNVYTYRNTLIVLLLAHILVGSLFHSYKDILRRGLFREIADICKHIALTTILALIILFFMKMTVYLSRMFMVYMVVIAFAYELVVHCIWKRVVRHRLKANPRQLIVVSDRANASRLVDTFARELKEFEVAGVVLIDETDATEVDGVPVVAHVSGLMDYVQANVVDEVLFHLPGNSSLEASLVGKCALMGITVHVELNEIYGMSDIRYNGHFAGTAVMTSYLKMITPGQAVMKRIIDICGAIVGLIITAVLTIFVAPAIYIADPGPIFFAQERVGKNGRTFKMYKFRSMYKDAEARKAELMDQNEMNGQMFKMENDPRIIGSGPDGTKRGVGSFIRSTSIDEFPQFWNVLVGDLSLVGTRPPLPSEVAEYNLEHHARLAVKPGITGLWQVSGRSEIEDFDEIVRLDTEYIRSWSVWLDIKILFKTVAVVLTRKGSK